MASDVVEQVLRFLREFSRGKDGSLKGTEWGKLAAGQVCIFCCQLVLMQGPDASGRVKSLGES